TSRHSRFESEPNSGSELSRSLSMTGRSSTDRGAESRGPEGVRNASHRGTITTDSARHAAIPYGAHDIRGRVGDPAPGLEEGDRPGDGGRPTRCARRAGRGAG